MTNLEVARELVRKAILSCRNGDTFSASVDLEVIFNLLDEPARDNDQYNWDDFKYKKV